jgi:hypothetical protein
MHSYLKSGMRRRTYDENETHLNSQWKLADKGPSCSREVVFHMDPKK